MLEIDQRSRGKGEILPDAGFSSETSPVKNLWQVKKRRKWENSRKCLLKKKKKMMNFCEPSVQGVVRMERKTGLKDG